MSKLTMEGSHRFPNWVLMRVMLFSLLVFSALASELSAQGIPGFSRSMNDPYLQPKRGLQAFPATRAIPIQAASPAGNLAPSAIHLASYSDNASLRTTATIRSIRFFDNQRGVAVGDHGLILVSRDGGQSWSPSDSGIECRLEDAIWMDESVVIAVGGGFDVVTRISRGVAVLSKDGGKTWRRANDTDLPRLIRLRIDQPSYASKSHGKASVIATGDVDPVSGAKKFESRDGQNWAPVLYPQQTAADEFLPVGPTTIDAKHAATWSRLTGLQGIIRTSCKLEDGALFCAGDHGTLMRSVDEGRSWQSARPANQGGATAVLFVVSELQQVPWALIARETLEQRVRCAVLVGRNESASVSPSSVGDVYQAASSAAMTLGISSMDAFVISAAGESLKHWIRAHRAPVVVFDSALPAELRAELLQYSVAGGASKVIEFSQHVRGESMLHAAAMMPSTGMLAGDFEDDARISIGHSISAPTHAPWVGIRTKYRTTDSNRQSSLVDGARLSDSHRLPKASTKASRRRLQVVQGRLKQNGVIRRLLSEQAEAGGLTHIHDDPIQALDQFLQQTSIEDRFRLAWSIVNTKQSPEAQAISWKWFAKEFPSSSVGKLTGLYESARRHSREWNWFRDRVLGTPGTSALSPQAVTNAIPSNGNDASPIVQTSGVDELLPQPGVHSTIVSPFQSATSTTNVGVVQAAAVSSVPARVDPTRTPPKPNGRSDSIPVDLAWEMHPIRLIVSEAIRRAELREAIALRDSGDEEALEELAAEGASSADLKRVSEQGTEWASLLKETSPQITHAVYAQRAPRLDGKLDEAFWSGAAITRHASPAKLAAAYDDRFVYLAIQVPVSRLGAAGADAAEIGKRDADLTSSDRLQIQLDVDRDLLTSFELGVTRDRRTCDSVDGVSDWDPVWYVATNVDKAMVVTELAIERSSLCDSISSGDQWFVNLLTISAGETTPRPWMPEAVGRIRIDFDQ